MSFNIEKVAAKLVPFDLTEIGMSKETVSNPTLFDKNSINSPIEASKVDVLLREQGLKPDAIQRFQQASGNTATTPSTAQTSVFSANTGGPLGPIIETGGLLFPYPPTISENISVKYDVTELVHSNENVHTYRSSDNVRITLSNCIWTADTFDNARYVLAVIHFFRTYRLMDFGRGTESPSRRRGTGRPPSPMNFSAFGNYIYRDVPVLLERAEFSLNGNEFDMVGVPNPGSAAFANKQLSSGQSKDISSSNGGEFSWVPIKFEVSSISLVVQHSVRYWRNQFSLDDYRTGKMLERNAGSDVSAAPTTATTGIPIEGDRT